MRTTIGMAKVGLRYSRTPQIIAVVSFAMGIIAYIVSYLVDNSGAENIGIGNFLFTFPVCLAIFVPNKYFTKLMNLGGKRKEFYKSAILIYAVASFAVAVMNTIFRYTIDIAMVSAGKLLAVLDLVDVFGFAAHAPVVAFFQMTVLLLMFCCVLHTLTLIQGRWYGWAVDALIVVMIFSPLNRGLLWLFDLLIFHDFAVVQVMSCLIFGATIYIVSFLPIKNKQI